MCNLTNTSARTIQRCFKKYFGLTIFKYIELYRLNIAYRILPYNSVSETAIAAGLTHLGRFSVNFKTLFAVSPSELIKN